MVIVHVSNDLRFLCSGKWILCHEFFGFYPGDLTESADVLWRLVVQRKLLERDMTLVSWYASRDAVYEEADRTCQIGGKVISLTEYRRLVGGK